MVDDDGTEDGGGVGSLFLVSVTVVKRDQEVLSLLMFKTAERNGLNG